MLVGSERVGVLVPLCFAASLTRFASALPVYSSMKLSKSRRDFFGFFIMTGSIPQLSLFVLAHSSISTATRSIVSIRSCGIPLSCAREAHCLTTHGARGSDALRIRNGSPGFNSLAKFHLRRVDDVEPHVTVPHHLLNRQLAALMRLLLFSQKVLSEMPEIKRAEQNVRHLPSPISFRCNDVP